MSFFETLSFVGFQKKERKRVVTQQSKQKFEEFEFNSPIPRKRWRIKDKEKKKVDLTFKKY